MSTRRIPLSLLIGFFCGLGFFLITGGTSVYGQETITIVGASGSGDASSGSLGNDAGWRMLGAPTTDSDGTNSGNIEVNDLTADVDGNGSVVEFDLPQGQMLYKWDDTAGSVGDWVAVTSSDGPSSDGFSASLPNGRGFLLFLFDDSKKDGDTTDDDADPLNSNLDLTASGTSPARNSNVSVSVTANDPDGDGTFHFLANPYDRAYDLSNLEGPGGTDIADGGTDFKTVLQVWTGGDSSGEDNATAGTYCEYDIGSSETLDDGELVHGVYGGDVSQTSSDCNDGDVLSVFQGFFSNGKATLRVTQKLYTRKKGRRAVLIATS